MHSCWSGSVRGRAERVALCVLRRVLLGEADESCEALVCPFGLGRDEAVVQRLFAKIWDDALMPPMLREIGAWRATKTECLLLRALAAAQAEDTALLARCLDYFAARRMPHQRFIAAMEALAATLAVHGYWLPQPEDLMPVPAAVLALARTQGRELTMGQIAWPGR